MIQKGHAAGYRQYSCRTSHKAGVQLLHRAGATLLHCRARLGANEVEHAFDSLLTESAEAPEIWPPNASRMRSYGKGLDHVGATAEPAVNDHRHAIVHCRDDFWKCIDCSSSVVFAASSMVGYDDSIHPILRSEFGIL